MFKHLITLLTVLLTVTYSYSLTMDEAVQTALEKNFQMLASQHEALASKYIAEKAKTPYMPQVEAEYSYLNSSEKAYGYVEDEIATFTLSVGYNLFNGFSDMYSLKAAKSSFAAQKYNTEAVKQDIILSARKAFIDVLAAIDRVTVANNAYVLLENQLKDTTLSYEVGYVAKNEVLKVKAELASSMQNVLSAKSSVRTAVFNLEKLMNTELDSGERFIPLSSYPEEIGTYKTLREIMVTNRSELKYLNELINAKNYSIKSTKGGYLPSVEIGAAYNTYGEDMSPSGRDYTYDNETVLSLKVNLSVFDGLNKYNTTRSLQEDKLSMINTMRETKANMSLQLKNALENFDLAKASLTSAESELESAQENYRITQNQFKQKVATNTDLLDARVMLTRAENTYNNAKFDIHRAVADVERIIEQDI
ncbi:outer membrane efflux protein [Denitrovibrio acetiphilus DSM 12809]|uniref:Outer membrane efflux protein n=1 Tax=Denitrovibrio acetiphilus (strain DSM 12809 / NBRC 114555 / N2460) TaxID=522772 RepID=D4H7V8_DENA2|nr:TolC family protein [Denitrovibrio acetiphilus]ADD68107.1 outer membrane efflux protein [Denitrovibrio acetiphilus DSM 12809]